jgi:protein phosphatase
MTGRSMHFKVGMGTDIGRKRSQNQDNCAAHPDLGLFMVSDGMGGHRGGEIASATAVETISNFVRLHQKQNKSWDPIQTMSQAIVAANQAIYQKALEQPQLQGMGTTTTAILFKGKTLIIGHVGDSRCYFIRPRALWQVTRDHSLVQEKLRAGLITRDEVKTDRMKNVITRSVGFELDVNVEIYQMMVQPRDCFLLCSDGLSGLIEDSSMLQLIEKNFFETGDIQKTVDQLISAANTNGGDDNITSILVQVLD